jgi:hypothetical protein
MSALPRRTDITGHERHVSFVPTGDIGAYSITSVAKPKTDVGISTPTIPQIPAAQMKKPICGPAINACGWRPI